ncbi:MAG: hypothetical protein GY789_12525 [Hyphomicrobiales bacterium]|nr:hypothetical protein [Hyphomicrobiales bacterium]MCP5001763.1 hypothetical protein [Hyphomicrobiales bacterium]
MTNSQVVAANTAGEHEAAKLALPVLIASLAAAFFLIGMHLVHGTDYVGADNDDVMRLVQIRDLMAGQGWFDLTQYRLGLDNGTQMHWSRLIDVPIALLIGLFSLFGNVGQAEAAALFVWPLLLLVPLFVGIAAAGRNLGDRSGMLVALFLGVFFVIVHNRFKPGAIDHHNVQLVLVILMMAGITDPRLSRAWCITAGISAALAIAIGAETIPVVIVVCATIAVLWAIKGRPARRGARYFGISFTAALAACFFPLTSPSAYGLLACDAFTGGFYLLGTAGGVMLFFVTAWFSDKTRLFRFSALACGGAIIGVAAVLIVPGCLQSPLADLDPLLRTMWLDRVTEARSVVSQVKYGPEDLAGFYAVPLIALGVCFWQAWRGERCWQNLVFAAAIAVAFTISLVQVRGSVFANLMAIVPLAAIIAEKQVAYRKSNRLGAAALQYACLALISIQFVWAVAGMLAVDGVDGVKTHSTVAEENTEDCADPKNLRSLAAQPKGVVSAVSNLGSDILRYTHHRVLSAPYHRNQSGMLTQLHIAMESEVDAAALIRESGVTLVAFCPTDPEARRIAQEHPDGLYALLGSGRVPDFLLPVDDTRDNPIRLFRVVQ